MALEPRSDSCETSAPKAAEMTAKAMPRMASLRASVVPSGRVALRPTLCFHDLEHLAERQSDQRRHGEFEDFVTEGIGIVQSLIALGVHFPVDVAQGRYHTVRCRFQIWRFTHGSIVMRDRRAFLPIRMGEARSGMMLRFPKTRGSKCRGSWAGSVRVGI